MEVMKNKKMLGFTLIELMVVLTIIAVLSTVGINAFAMAQKKGRDTKRIATLREIVIAVSLTIDPYNGGLRVTKDNVTGKTTFDEEGTVSGTGNCTTSDCSVFLKALGGAWPSFPN